MNQVTGYFLRELLLLNQLEFSDPVVLEHNFIQLILFLLNKKHLNSYEN
jgi:hypothetical protein